MNTKMILFTLVGAANVAACGDSSMSMSHQTGEMDLHLADLEKEASAHVAAITVSADLTAVVMQEDGHYGRSMGHMDGMGRRMDDMGMCRDSAGGAPDMAGMAAEMAEMRKECEGHKTAMGSSPNLASAIAEEKRHEGMMSERLKRMRDHQADMSAIAGHYSCRMDRHSM